MTTKPWKTTTNPVGKGAVSGRSGSKRTTKGDRLIQLLKARSGRDIAALSAELAWQPHTTRAALSRLRKAGYTLEKLAPGKHGGARYRIASAPAEAAR
jgi:hypothetical protein